MRQFLMLLRRECMQHHIGWLILLAAPALLLLIFSQVGSAFDIHVDIQADGVALPALRNAPGAVQIALSSLAVLGNTFALALLTVAFQLPGLARRDQHDGSIDFWCALPVGHAKALAATLVAHWLLLPWAALVAGLLGGLVVGLLNVASSHGPQAWLHAPWWPLLGAGAALLVRLMLGLLLALAWLSPLLLLTLAASAWLKRWGLPVVVASALAGGLLLDPRLATPVVLPALQLLSAEALQAMVQLEVPGGVDLHNAADLTETLQALPGLLLREFMATLGRAASPAFGLALAGAALGFWLLVLRRQRGH